MPANRIIDKNGAELFTDTNPANFQQVLKRGQIQGHNALAIRTTSNNDVGPLDISTMLGQKMIPVSSTLDQTVNITVYARNGNSYDFASVGLKTVNANSSVIITDTDMPGLRESLKEVRIRAVCATAPTTGSISTFVEGVVTGNAN